MRYTVTLLLLCVFSSLVVHAQALTSIDGSFLNDRVVVKLKQNRLGTSQGLPQDLASLPFIKSAVQIHPGQFRKESAILAYKGAIASEQHPVGLLWEISLQNMEAAEAIRTLSDHAAIAYCEPVAMGTFFGEEGLLPNDPMLANQSQLWNFFRTRTPEAWQISRGDSNVVIGIIDSGVRLDHPDMAGQLYYNNAERYGQPGVDDDGNGFVDDSLGYDFADRTNILSHWHGTGVASIASATPNNNIGFAGVGYYCRYMPVKVVRLAGNVFQMVDLYKAILYAAENGCKVINLSLGQSAQRMRWEQEIIDYVVLQKDVVVVAAAGNNNLNNPSEADVFPASYDHVVSVISSDRNDRRASNALIGNFVDLMAPGVDVQGAHIGPDYVLLSGSSYAAPMVSGAAALIRSKYPELNASQVTALIRATTDNVYDLPENAGFRERLGTGRLNVFRALQERHQIQAMGVKHYGYGNGFANFAYPGDTLLLWTDVVNYFRPGSPDTRVSISSTSPHVSIVQSVFNTGSMQTMQLKSNRDNPFRIYIAPSAPLNGTIRFRIELADINYIDHKYIDIPLSGSLLNVMLNQLSFSIASDGRIGHQSMDTQQGIGFSLANEQLLSGAGLMLGWRPWAVSNAVIAAPGTSDNHFLQLSPFRPVEKGLQTYVAQGTFNDGAPSNSTPLHIEIKQRMEGRINTPHHRYVVIRYQLSNRSAQVYDSIGLGLYTDWNLGNGQNRALWHEEGQFGYTTTTSGNLLAGVKVFALHQLFYALDKDNVPGNPIPLGDGFSMAEKYTTLSSGIGRKQAGLPQGSDVAQVSGAVLKQWMPNETREVVMVIAAANELSALEESFAQAALVLDPNTPRGAKPQLRSIICASPVPLRISPSGGSTFRFYSADNLAEPLHIGGSFEVNAEDSTRIFYISQVDSLLEGEPVKYQFNTHTAKAFFNAVDSINLADSGKVYFSDASLDAVQWHWQFDSLSTSMEANPVHQFNKPGSYQVTLTITDQQGCQASYSKTIKVVRLVRSPVPLVNFTHTVCSGQPVLIQPQGGARFRFYHNEWRPDRPFQYEGNSYQLSDTTVKRVFITNLDSAFESFPTVTEIVRTRLRARFDFSPKADTVIYDFITFTDQSSGDLNIIKHEWDFGDDSPRVRGTQVQHKYSAQGRYTVTLRVTDFSGCSDSTSATFSVGKQGPIPLLETNEMLVCSGSTISIAPLNGSKFNFYDSPPPATPVFSGKVYTFSPELSKSIWITNTDSIVESNASQVQILVFNLRADFSYNQASTDNTDIEFTNQSMGGYNWIWNFGDGNTAEGERNVTHRYQRQGVYKVSLQVFGEHGCSALFSKEITVKRSGPQPVVEDVAACAGAVVQVRPQGGSRFNFYHSWPSSQPFHTGSSWQTATLSQSTQIFVTNADSLAESAPVPVRITINTIQEALLQARVANRLLSSGDTIQLGDTVFVSSLNQDALNWEWDFGNSFGSLQKTTFVRYAMPGVYNIRLRTRNEFNCESVGNLRLFVVNRNTVGTRPEDFVSVMPNPSSGNTTIVVQLPQPKIVQVEVYNLLGQQIARFEEELVEDLRSYTIDLLGQQKGMYLIRLWIGGEQVVKRLIYR